MNILKTYKIYIGGQFPRTESGRYYIVKDSKGNSIANVCQSSKKDIRNAVQAARKAFGNWSERSAYNRGQIMYRIAEMLEGRKSQFVDELVSLGQTTEAALNEVERSIDRIVYYAGWCDKFQQVLSSVNPVNSAHFNFSVPEPMGVIGIVADQGTGLIGLVSQLMPVLAGGNTALIIASENSPLSAITFAEVLETSDVPAGVVNILTGSPNEMLPTLAEHMDVNGLFLTNMDLESLKQTQIAAVDNLKRVVELQMDWSLDNAQGISFISKFQEIKTTWHPIEHIGGATSTY
ncbi:MAG: aldehyde dehydrogenase family protein [Flavobacteriales bacterium]